MQTDKAYGKDLVSKILATARGTEPVFLTTAWLTTKGIQAKLDGEHHVKATEREIRDILADLAKERRVTTSRGKGTYQVPLAHGPRSPGERGDVPGGDHRGEALTGLRGQGDLARR